MTAVEVALGALPFLWQGLLVTIHVSLLSVALSLAAGLLLGLALTFGNRLVCWPIRIFTDVIRGIPILVLLFLIYYLLPFIGIDTTPYWSGVLALSVFKTAHTIEIVRGSIQSVPHGQFDAGKAIGLTFWQRMLYVAFPQALRRFLPPWINSVADTVKGSALVSLLGVVDLMLAVQQVVGRTYVAMPVYVLGALLYFAINYTLSSLSRRLESRFAAVRE
jgi:polar amino acid transport system permease protein